MKSIYILMLILIGGCVGSSGSVHYYKKIDSSGTLYEEKLLQPETYNNKTYTIQDRKIFKEYLDNYVVRDNIKKYCVYTLLFIPINFWDITSSTSVDMQQAIKDLNQEGKIGNEMQDIIFWKTTDVFFPFISICSTITGTLLYEE